MGHVDHGKTKLLDRIRQRTWSRAKRAASPSTSARTRSTSTVELITFIDTPGHEAFTAMRARGANVTDIVVLVVAADDGVMPQTVEAINHAKAADVPIVVAINKIDRADADPNRVMQQLSEHGLVPEEWGGDTIMVEVSALQDLGIDDLLEQLLVVAEVEELTANPEGPRPRASCSRPTSTSGQGPVATVIVDKGTLRVGDTVVAGAAWGKVRALIDDHGDHIKEALAVAAGRRCSGCRCVPAGRRRASGCRHRREDRPRRSARPRAQRFRLGGLRRKAPSVPVAGAKLEDIFEQIQRGETATLNLVLKADVQGSLEAVTESLRKLERDEVKLAFVHRAVGGITEYDVNLAAASNATIIGFNVRPDRRSPGAGRVARRRDPDLRDHLQADRGHRVRHGRHARPRVRGGRDRRRRGPRDLPRPEHRRGRRLLRAATGRSPRGSKVRFLREGTIIWKGAIRSLRRFKDDVREVAAGLRVRHRPLRLPGPQARRHHRDLRGAGDPPHLSPLHAAALSVELHLPQARSLKDKRAVLRPLIEGCRRRYGVAVAEVGNQDLWQRAGVAVATVSSTPRQVAEVLDACERFVWSFPEVEVISCERHWWGP